MQAKRLFVTLTFLFSLLFLNFAQAQRNRPIDFPDAAFRAKIAEALGKRSDAVITAVDMLDLTILYAADANIRNLNGVQHAHNLRKLGLGGAYIKEEKRNSYNNAISDLSPIQGLTQLTYLDLSGNDVSDISPLAGLTALTTLGLYNNPISDVSPLVGLTQLMSLDLGNTSVSDVSSLVKLVQLTDLNISGTQVSTVSPLSELTQLTSLSVFDTSLSDISAIKGLTRLTTLGLGWNSISDISPLKGLTQLTILSLSGNDISDVSPLSNLTQLEVLRLSDNAILDVSPLVRLNLTGTQWDSTGLYVKDNPLSYASVNRHIPTMQAKGVEVEFDERTPTVLLKISDPTQKGVVNTALPLPFIVKVLDQEGQAFASVPVKFAVTAGKGKLNATTVKTDAIGRATAHLTLGRTVGKTTVRVTATNISQPVQFTATAILRNSPVIIPDANLRVRIMETLRKPRDKTPTASDMLKLTRLAADNADILDLVGLQHATNLKSLSLDNNSVSNLSPLAGLTQLTMLNLRNNRISNVSPLAGLTQLTTLNLTDNWISNVLPLIDLAQLKGSKELHQLYLQGNPLSDVSIYTHIPMLQAEGVNVRFDSLLTQPGPIVRLIYFLPRDRQSQPDINTKMDQLIKDVQQDYADWMEAHGFGRKTFRLETDKNGDVIVHHVVGRLTDSHYSDHSWNVWEEIGEQFDLSKNFYLTVLDVSSGILNSGTARGLGGSNGAFEGKALIPAPGGQGFNDSVAGHELGHAFGGHHYYNAHAFENKMCPWEELDVHPAFNANQVPPDKPTTIKMLPSSPASLRNTIRLRFAVTDPNGIHQVQLLTRDPHESHLMLDCKRLNGQPNHTVEFVTTVLAPKNKHVYIKVIDIHGFRTFQAFPIDIITLLPPPEVVSIPDTNLAAAVRQEIGNSITTHTMLNLLHLSISNHQISDLTGLEHAHNLREIFLRGEFLEKKKTNNSNTILDWSPLKGLTQLAALACSSSSISDVSSLVSLTQLTWLDLSNNDILDISPLSELTQLGYLNLRNNNISDVSPLAKLTQLGNVSLSRNSISDVSPLAKLTQLENLYLTTNDISDISPLTELTQLTDLSLGFNPISDISPLAKLTQLEYLYLAESTISDVSPLVELKLTKPLHLWNNPLSYASIHTHIPVMEAKGIVVSFDDTAHPALLKISGDRQEGTVGEALPKPFIVEAMNAQGQPMEDVSITFSIATGGGRLSSTNATTNANGRARSTLTLGQTAGKHTIRVSATGIQSSVMFTANATEPPIYWIEKNTGTLHRSIGITVKNLVPRVQNATSLTVDVARGKLYWTEQTGKTTGKIQRANLNGSNVQLVKELTSVPQGLAIDPINNKLYLTNAWGKIQRLNFDGSNFQPNLITGLDAPKGVVLDVMKGKLYWIEQTSNTTGKIQNANLDGSNVQLVKKLTSAPRGLALDTVNGKLYLTNAWGKIQRLNLDGSNFEPNFITSLDSPEGIALDIAKGKLYWTEMNSIKCGDLSGGNVQEVVAGLGRPTSIALTIVPVEPAIAAAPARLSVPPTTTDLLPNYPNPFNPETWIPYQLAEPAEVTLTIYAVNGHVVRTVALGHQPAGIYHGKSRAGYWDGRNAQGERVASGVYFYTLSAGDFTATRKLLIRK